MPKEPISPRPGRWDCPFPEGAPKPRLAPTGEHHGGPVLTAKAKLAEESPDILAQAFPDGAVVLLLAPPGPDKASLLIPLLMEGLEGDSRVLVAVAEIPPGRVLHLLAQAGADVASHRGNGSLRVVDWYTHKEEKRSETLQEDGVIRCPATLESLEDALAQELADPGPDLAVLEVLTDVAWFGTDRYRELVAAWREGRTGKGRTVLVLEPDLVPQEAVEVAREAADAWVRLERRAGAEGPRWRLSLPGDDGELSYRLATAPPFLSFRAEAEEPDAPPEAATAAAEASVAADEAPVRTCPQCDAPLEGDACATCGYSEVEARRARIQEIYQVCEDRLRENPEDTDALFTKAVALARLKEYDDAVETLNTLTRLSPRYPALWMLKAKLFDRLGDEVKANLCRQRAVELEKEELGTDLEVRLRPDAERFQCPLCRRWLPLDASVCPCGAEFVEEEA